MFVEKTKPGHYTVWVGDVFLVFRNERDAERFCRAARYAKVRSWIVDELAAMEKA